MQMKATVRYHYTLIRKAKRKKSDKINADEKAENPEHSYAAEGNVRQHSHSGKVWWFLKSLNIL